MFNPSKSGKIVKSAEISGLKKSKSLDTLNTHVTTLHTSPALNARAGGPFRSNLNKPTIIKLDDLPFMDKFQEVELKNNHIIRSESLKEYEKALALSQQRIFNIRVHLYDRAEIHSNFYEIIEETSDSVKICVLPLTTSHNPLNCGVEAYQKLLIYKPEEHSMDKTHLYITRLLFEKIMTREEFDIFKQRKSKLQDKLIEKEVFDKVIQDMTNNSYSILRDTDLKLENISNIDINSGLEKIRFVFTPLEYN